MTLQKYASNATGFSLWRLLWQRRIRRQRSANDSRVGGAKYVVGVIIIHWQGIEDQVTNRQHFTVEKNPIQSTILITNVSYGNFRTWLMHDALCLRWTCAINSQGHFHSIYQSPHGINNWQSMQRALKPVVLCETNLYDVFFMPDPPPPQYVTAVICSFATLITHGTLFLTLILIPAWISNPIQFKTWDEITSHFSNLQRRNHQSSG